MTQPLNTPAETMVAQARENLQRDLPIFVQQPAHAGKLCIVGGGPSLADSLPKLHREKARGALIMALNNTHDYLIDRGIVPHFHAMLDARPENVAFVSKPRRGVTYLMAAQCHPSVFDALAGQEVIAWVADVPGMVELADEVKKPITLIGGGSTVGSKAMMLAFLWGFRQIGLFGFDGCYRGEAHHAYKQPLNDAETRLEAQFVGKTFTCAPWMVQQAHDFHYFAQLLINAGVRLKAYGDGLLPAILDDLQKGVIHAAA